MSEQPREGVSLEGTPVCVSQDEVWFAENMVCLGISFSLECSLMSMVWGFRKRDFLKSKLSGFLPVSVLAEGWGAVAGSVLQSGEGVSLDLNCLTEQPTELSTEDPRDVTPH